MSRILGILCKDLGDCVLINTLTKGIKIKFPNIELDWIIEEKYRNIIENNSDIKNIIIIDKISKDWDKILGTMVSNVYSEIMIFQQ